MHVPRSALRDVALVLLSVATVALTVYALQPSDPPGGGQVTVATESGTPSPDRVPSTGPSSASSVAPSPLPAAMPQALIVGDELVSTAPTAFAAQLLRARNWVGKVDSGGAFATRELGARLEGSYDVVVLCALQAPEAVTDGQARQMVLSSILVTRQAQPDAVLVLVGPLALDGEPSAGATRFNQALKRVGVEQKVSVISPIDERWVIVAGVAVDPSRQVVQDVIAARLTEALARRPQVPRGEPAPVAVSSAETPSA